MSGYYKEFIRIWRIEIKFMRSLIYSYNFKFSKLKISFNS